jgi:glycine/D-amino acid oxidase-like deaminating enzyme
MTGRHVAVVGGGLAGLAAAARLEGRGARVTLLGSGEADEPARISLGETEIEPELHLVPRRHPALDELIEQTELGGAIRERALDGALEIVGARHRPVSLRGTGLLGVGRATPVWDAWRRQRLGSLVRWFEPILDRCEPEAGARLDDRSIGDFARVYLGRRRAHRSLEALADAGFGLDAEATSRLLLFLWLDRSGRLSLSRLCGVSALREALAARISDVRANARVAAIQPDGRGLELEDGSKVDCDAAVIALRGDRVRARLPGLSPLEADVLAHIGYASRVILAVRTTDAAAEADSLSWIPGCERGLLAGIVEAGERVLLLVGRSHSPSVHAPNDDRGPTEALLCGAERALPGIRSRIEATCLYRTARPRFDVGHYRAVASLRREQARRLGTRRIALAGDYLVGPDLESAARSGFRAADDIETALA